MHIYIFNFFSCSGVFHFIELRSNSVRHVSSRFHRFEITGNIIDSHFFFFSFSWRMLFCQSQFVGLHFSFLMFLSIIVFPPLLILVFKKTIPTIKSRRTQQIVV